jgi:tRNA-dihydrouridine synthase A
MSKIAIAPMLDWTDRHYRYFMRLITKHTQLYTEMVVAEAIIHGNQERLLGFDNAELPLVVQVGGSNPNKLALVSKVCQGYGYSEINLNVGCPSARVKSGNFGACLMQEAGLVADCIKAMQDSVSIPVTVKNRIGVDKQDSYEFMRDFVLTVAETGCNKFIVHARNAILSGLSPKENREIPPLKYDYVYRLKAENPQLHITINGGIKTVAEIKTHLQYVDGVMIGREAYHNPYLLNNFDELFYLIDTPVKSRIEIAYAMLPYLEAQQQLGLPLHKITRHMIGLFHGCANAKLWRQTLTTQMIKENSLSVYTHCLSILDCVGQK